MNLWKLDPVVGMWKHCRDCEPDSAQAWLHVWQKAEPMATFMLSDKRPIIPAEKQLRKLARKR